MRAFLSQENSWANIQASDLPAINTLSGQLDISQLNPSGVTGQTLVDIGFGGLRWRHIGLANIDPAFISGSGTQIPLITTTGLTAGDFIKYDGSKYVNTSTITGTWNGTAIAAQYGGTGINGASAANGKLLIGNGSGYTLANLTQGTGVTITNGSGSITIAATGTGIASINGDTTSAQTINAGTDLAASTVAGVTTVARGIQSGSAFYWIVPSQFIDTTSTSAVGAANRVHVHRFYLPYRFSVSAVTFRIATGVAASNASIGIYSDDGNSRYIDTGPQSSATGSTTVTVTLGVPVVLSVGFYWFALTCSSTTPTFLCTSSSTFFNTTILNEGTVHLGRAANTSTAGQLPATLGAITAEDRSAFVCKLQG